MQKQLKWYESVDKFYLFSESVQKVGQEAPLKAKSVFSRLRQIFFLQQRCQTQYLIDVLPFFFFFNQVIIDCVFLQSYCDDPDLVLELKNLIVIFADTLQVGLDLYPEPPLNAL